MRLCCVPEMSNKQRSWLNSDREMAAVRTENSAGKIAWGCIHYSFALADLANHTSYSFRQLVIDTMVIIILLDVSSAGSKTAVLRYHSK